MFYPVALTANQGNPTGMFLVGSTGRFPAASSLLPAGRDSKERASAHYACPDKRLGVPVAQPACAIRCMQGVSRTICLITRKTLNSQGSGLEVIPASATASCFFAVCVEPNSTSPLRIPLPCECSVLVTHPERCGEETLVICFQPDHDQAGRREQTDCVDHFALVRAFKIALSEPV